VPLKVIIYDCDGVLFDSKKANEAFYNHILDHFGMPPLVPHQLEFVHVSTAQEAVDFLFQSNPQRDEAQAYRQVMDYQPYVPLLSLEPHVREVLAYLQPRYRTAIATNRGLSMPLVMKDHCLSGFFGPTVTSMDVTNPKPHPECLWKILSHFAVAPEEALYIGDAEIDRLVSERAGVPFAAYKKPSLAALYHFEDHLDLLALLPDGREEG